MVVFVLYHAGGKSTVFIKVFFQVSVQVFYLQG